MQTMLPFVVQKSRAHIKGLLRDNFWYNNVFSFLQREFIPLNSPHLENDWKVCAKVLNPFNGIAQNDFIAQDCNHWREKITDLNFVSIFVSWKNSYLSKISFHLNENEFYKKKISFKLNVTELFAVKCWAVANKNTVRNSLDIREQLQKDFATFVCLFKHNQWLYNSRFMNDNRFIIFNGNDNGGEMEFFTHYRFQMPKKR